MKKFIFLTAFLVISNFAFAEKYAFQDSEGVHIVTLADPSTTIEKELAKMGKSHVNAVIISDEDIPKTRADRKYWKLSGSKVIIDTYAKQVDLDKEAQEFIEKKAVLDKLKVSEEELEKLRI